MILNRRQFLWVSAPALCRAAETRMVANAAELSRAAADSRPGDTIVLRDGEWRDAALTVHGEDLTVRAETAGKVVLSGRSTLSVSGLRVEVSGVLFSGASTESDLIRFRTSTSRLAVECRITDCAIVDSNPPDSATNTKWVSLYGARNQVDHCYFAGKKNLGTTLVVWLPASGESNYHWIHHNHFGPRPFLGVNGAETIRVGDSATQTTRSYTLVESNYFDQCDGEVEIISNKSCENVYRGNTFENCAGTLTLRHGDRCLVMGNHFFGHGKRNTGGVRVIGEDHRVLGNYFEGLRGTGTRAALCLMNGIPDSPPAGYFQVKRALIGYNTIVDCTEALVVGYSSGADVILPPVECLIAGNAATSEARVLDEKAQVRWQGNRFPAPDLQASAQPARMNAKNTGCSWRS